MEAIKVTRKQVEALVNATFPDYTGRKFAVHFAENITFYDTNWSGGTRNEYAAVRVDGRTAHFVAPAPWVNGLEGKTAPLPVDIVVVEHSIFCGKDCGITIYANPVHAPKWLPAGR